MAKRPVPQFDFTALGKAIKKARMERRESRKVVSDALFISPRYLANIENKGQHPSLQVFYDLVSRYRISVDQYFSEKESGSESEQRLRIMRKLQFCPEKYLPIIEATLDGAIQIDDTEDVQGILRFAITLMAQ